MALQLQVESLEGLDEGVQQFYQQDDDGKYRLAVEGLEDTDGLKSALEKERKARKDYEKKMKNLEDVDPDEYRKLKEQQRKNEEKKLQDEGEFEKLREKWRKEMEDKEQKLKAEIEKRDHQLDTLYLQEEVKRSALQAGVDPNDLEDVLESALVKKSIKRGDDGQSIQVLDKDGEVSAQTLDDFFSKTFKEAKPKFYKPDVLPGGGTKPSNSSGKSQDWHKLSPVERMNAARQAK